MNLYIIIEHCPCKNRFVHFDQLNEVTLGTLAVRLVLICGTKVKGHKLYSILD